MEKLIHVENKLQLTIPKYLFEFIASLNNEEVAFGEETWMFWTVNDNVNEIDDNFILKSTISFIEEWTLDGLVFATNGIGDYILLLKNENNDFKEEIFVLMHEVAEIRLFASSWTDLIHNGPIEYFWNEEYIYKIDEDGVTVKGEFEIDPYFKDYDLKSKIDDLIDERDETKLNEIIDGLRILSESKDESHKAWAYNKFSDYYLRGFGYLQKDIILALEYNQKAMELNNHKAFSNRAAAYFAGIGVERNIEKALEFAEKANELSKSNIFASDISEKINGGLYEDLVKTLKREIKKNKKK
jgi:hypothetical protein